MYNYIFMKQKIDLMLYSLIHSCPDIWDIWYVWILRRRPVDLFKDTAYCTCIVQRSWYMFYKLCTDKLQLWCQMSMNLLIILFILNNSLERKYSMFKKILIYAEIDSNWIQYYSSNYPNIIYMCMKILSSAVS